MTRERGVEGKGLYVKSDSRLKYSDNSDGARKVATSVRIEIGRNVSSMAPKIDSVERNRRCQ